MLVLGRTFGRVSLILRFAAQFAQLQVDALAKLLAMLEQLAIGLVNLHQQVVVDVGVHYARLRGRRVGRLQAPAAVVSAVLLAFRQRAD